MWVTFASGYWNPARNRYHQFPEGRRSDDHERRSRWSDRHSLDGSKSSIAALEWAASQAELTGAGLEVLMTWEWPTSYGMALAVPSEYDPTHESEKLLDDLQADS
jgi:hypothetical protein